jgi:hypothetical protein
MIKNAFFFPGGKEENNKTSNDLLSVQLALLVNLFAKNSSDIINQDYPNINFSRENLEKEVSKKMITLVDEMIQQTLLNRFEVGEFDKLIFTENPKLTKELKALIEIDNRAFVERLFVKCESRKTLEAWFKNGVKLPANPVDMAVMLRSKKVVFEYLYSEGCFQGMHEQDKESILQKAKKRLNENTFNYLIDMLGAKQKLTLI